MGKNSNGDCAELYMKLSIGENMKLKLCAVVLFGLEGVCADELKRNGFEDVIAENGRVLFTGNIYEAARANLLLHTAERIYILINEFQARSFDELFEGVARTPFEDIIPRNGAFPVKGHSIRSKLTSIPDCQSIIKKATATRLGKKYGLVTLPENGELYQITFRILNDKCSIYIDTSGEGLYKRGYRKETNIAPIRETLAAGLVLLSKRRGDRPLFDPMCGSGTILIEAALIASRTAPGLKRKFAFEKFINFELDKYKKIRQEISDKIVPFSGEISGSDISHIAIKAARNNAHNAGFGDNIKLTAAGLDNAKFPDHGIIITNPPYGERMGDIESNRDLIKELGRTAKDKKLGTYVISSDLDLERYFDYKANKKRKLYNGNIRCDYFMFFPAQNR